MEKLKWILSLLMVIMLIVTTNLVDQASFEKINDASEKIYSDRLVAQDLIFKYSGIIHKKELALELADTAYYRQDKKDDDEQIEFYNRQYQATELTDLEAERYSLLYIYLEDLMDMENKLFFTLEEDSLISETRNKLDSIKYELITLNQIQLIEGRRESFRSKSEMDTVNLFTKMEIVLIIVLSIVILMLLFAKFH